MTGRTVAWALVLVAPFWAAVGLGFWLLTDGGDHHRPRVVCSQPVQTHGRNFGASSIHCRQKP